MQTSPRPASSLRQAADSWLHDLGYTLRTLRRSAAFTAVAVLMLALGIGVNAAVFTVTRAALFRGFRLVDRNDRLLYIHSQKDGQYSGVSEPDLQDWQTQAKSFDGIGAVADLRITLNDQTGFPERFTATQVTANAFRLLGVKPLLGRDFAPSDALPGAPPVAILSYRLWESRFGKDPAIAGQSLHINDAPPATIIGVMPSGFAFPQDQDLWVPLIPTPNLQRRDARDLWFAFGRIAVGVTRQQAQTELETIGSRLALVYPRTNQGQIPQQESFAEFFIGPNASLIYGAIWGAVGFVLLIACGNVANLLLARALGRSRELSLRMSLGAGRWRIVRQLLMESLVLSGIACAVGWWIAKIGVRFYVLATNPQAGEWKHDLLDYTMDYRVLAYLIAISLAAGLLCGLAPALRFSRLQWNTVLKAQRVRRAPPNGSGTVSRRTPFCAVSSKAQRVRRTPFCAVFSNDGGPSASGGRKRLSNVLVAAEVALALVLLTGAGAMLRSFRSVATADIGVRTENTIAMFLHLPDTRYSRRESQIAFFDRLQARLETIPGVDSASVGIPPASGLPGRRPYELAGQSPSSDSQSRPTAVTASVGPGYFRTLGAAVRSGREFTRLDGFAATPVAIVNQRFAAQHWPGATALGQRVRLFDGETPEAWLTVVGVVPDIVYSASRQDSAPMLYMPYGQSPRGGDSWILIHTSLPPSGLISGLRREIAAVDPGIPIWLGPYNLEDRLAAVGLYGNIRTHTALFLIFGVIALLLASLGVYAVVAHSVRQRTREIGIRIAVGASARDIFRIVFRLGMLPVAIGVAIGFAASFALIRVLASELIHVSASDPITAILSCGVLLLSAFLGCWLPARRAMSVDPVVALRHG